MKLSGIPASPGISAGKVMCYAPYDSTNETWSADSLMRPEERVRAYLQAKSDAIAELENAAKCCGTGPENASILEAHSLLLADVAIDDDIHTALMDGCPASDAIITVYQKYIDLLLCTDEALTRERAMDMRDVRNRLLRCLAGKPEKNLSKLPAGTIVVAKELQPSDTAVIDRDHIVAIVTEEGGTTSHTAILARSYCIPTVLGATGILDLVRDGDELLVDAVAGHVYVNPTSTEQTDWSSSMERFQAARRCRDAYSRQQAITMDGTVIFTELNLSDVSVRPEEVASVDGAGLLRSEFLFLENQRPPCEEEQFVFYRKALEAFSGKMVILRTLDMGGDKQTAYLRFSEEVNPFLGKRGIRLCFDRPDLFHTQLRAALRASVYGDLRLMFPMVGSLDDWHRARELVHGAMEELKSQKVPFNANIPLGIMIEVPSIALMAEEIADEVDFASIGTNDLCQYLMAADRINPGVTSYHQPFHPAVFRILQPVVKAFAKRDKLLSVCGEMGGDPAAILALMGLGIRAFSMGAASVASAKCMICNTTIEEAEHAAKSVCGACTEAEAKKFLKRYMDVIDLRMAERGAHA